MDRNSGSTFHVKRTPQRIAILKPSALGDVVHALPVLSALRTRFPNAHLTWIVNRAYADLLTGHPHLDEVLTYDRQGLGGKWFGGAASFLSILGRINGQRFDWIIDLQGLLRTGLMSLASRAPVRIGLASAREGAVLCYNYLLQDDLHRMHAVDRYWLAAHALGIGNLPKQFIVPISSEARHWAWRQLAGLPRPWLTLNLGTRWETKRWPVRHFVELTQQALRDNGGTFILVGGSGDAPLGQEFLARMASCGVNLIGHTSIKQLAAVLELTDVMISNDSGPLHLAAALGRPVLAPYTCTSPVRTGPYGQADAAVCTQIWCAGSYLKTCSRMDCMRELTPGRFYLRLQRLLLSCPHQSA